MEKITKHKNGQWEIEEESLDKGIKSTIAGAAAAGTALLGANQAKASDVSVKPAQEQTVKAPVKDIHSQLKNLKIMGEYHVDGKSHSILREPSETADWGHPSSRPTANTSKESLNPAQTAHGSFYGPDAEKANEIFRAHIAKMELDLDKEIEENKAGKFKEEPDFAVSRNEMRDIKTADKQKIKPKVVNQIPPVQSKVPLTKSVDESNLDEKLDKLEKALEDLKKQNFKAIQEQNRGKELVGVKGYGSDLRVGGGPAMTGKPRHYAFEEKTKSGKTIMSTDGREGEAPYHSGFTADDHKDAYYAHGNQANDLKKLKGQVHPDLITHHENQAAMHWRVYQGMLQQKRGG